ncbi:MAG: glycosyltransferase family 4 protein [Planctomycetes bacterium]|nr:glycosyltransferase family 4 protein [Planctomycetota bacterium]
MRILTVIDVFSFTPAGGAGTVMYNIARELSRRGNDMHVICRRRNDLPLEGVIDGINFHTYDANPQSHTDLLSKGTGMVRKIFSDLHKQKPFDALHGHHPLPVYAIKRLDTAKNLPCFMHFHSPWHEEYLTRKTRSWKNFYRLPAVWFFSSMRRRTEKWALDNSTKIICLSDYMKQKIAVTHKIREDKIAIVPGAADMERFVPVADKTALRKKLALPADKFILYTVRSLIPRTGIDKLIKAMQIILPEAPDAVLVIGGTGPLEDELKQMAEDMGIDDNVIFTGFIPNEYLAPYYQASDLVVMPTQELEGFGLVTVEAMACGVPVTATPVGGNIEVLSGFDKSLLTAEKDETAIAQTILSLYNDKARMSGIADRCREYVEQNYTWQKVADKLLKLLTPTTINH